MPRPVKDDPRDCIKTFRFTEGESARIAARARASGHTVSSYVRMLILEGGASAQSPKISPGAKASPGEVALATGPREYALMALADQMRRVGVNLNQIAHRMNELKTPPPRELTALLAELRTYVRQARGL